MENKNLILEDFESSLLNNNRNIIYKNINKFNEKYKNFEYLNLIRISDLSSICNNVIINNLDSVKNFSKYNFELEYFNKIFIDKDIKLN